MGEMQLGVDKVPRSNLNGALRKRREALEPMGGWVARERPNVHAIAKCSVKSEREAMDLAGSKDLEGESGEGRIPRLSGEVVLLPALPLTM